MKPSKGHASRQEGKVGEAEALVVDMEEVDLKGALAVAGFIGPGLVAQISVDHMVSSLKMHQVGFIRSRHVPPVAVFIGGKLRHPFRVYSTSDRKAVAILCEVPLPPAALYPVSCAIFDWAEEKGIEEMIVLEGVPTENLLPAERQIYCAAEPGKCRAFEERGVQVADHAFIGGMAGAILGESLTRGVPGVALITQALAFMPDPGGAIRLLEALNSTYGFQIVVKDLIEKEEEIRNKLAEVSRHYKRLKDAEKAAPETMYG